MQTGGKTIKDIQSAGGPILVVNRVSDVAYGEVVEVLGGDTVLSGKALIHVCQKDEAPVVYHEQVGLTSSLPGFQFWHKKDRPCTTFFQRNIEQTSSVTSVATVHSAVSENLTIILQNLKGSRRE